LSVSIREKLTQLEFYGLGDLDEIDSGLSLEPAIRIRNLEGGWPLWLDLVRFCQATDTPMETFTQDLDFSPLDT